MHPNALHIHYVQFKSDARYAVLQAAVPDNFYTVMHRAFQTEPVAAPLTWLLWVSVTCLCTWLIIGTILVPYPSFA